MNNSIGLTVWEKRLIVLHIIKSPACFMLLSECYFSDEAWSLTTVLILLSHDFTFTFNRFIPLNFSFTVYFNSFFFLFSLESSVAFHLVSEFPVVSCCPLSGCYECWLTYSVLSLSYKNIDYIWRRYSSKWWS